MRARLIGAEALAAAAQASAVLLVAPGDLSTAFALVMIVTGVLPGLMLTGDVKLLNAGVIQSSRNLVLKTVASAALNVPLGAAVLFMQGSTLSPAFLAFLVAFGTIGATAQTFSSTWYYVQPDRSRVIRSKLASVGVKVGFAAAAVWFSELTFALLGMGLGAAVEFAMNFRSLPWRGSGEGAGRRAIVSPLGLAYGVSRVISAGIKVGLSALFGSLIASFLLIEQLVGGANSIFEKYFVRSVRWRQGIRAVKILYLVAMLGFVPWLASQQFTPENKISLLWLAMVACTGLLPLAEMYIALERRGQTYVAVGSGVISGACAAILYIAWLTGNLNWAALVAYVALPGLTFLFYWFSSTHARHHPQHQADE